MLRSSTTTRGRCLRERQCRLDVAGFSHHGEVRLAVEHAAKPAANQRMIVGEQIGIRSEATSTPEVGHGPTLLARHCAKRRQGASTMRAATRPASTSAIDSLTRVERADLADHLGLAGGVQLEHLAQVRAGADDRADDRDPVQHGLEDRQRDVVVGRQRDEHERAAPAQRAVGLLERPRRHRERDRLVGTAERLDRLDGILAWRR